MGSDVVHPSHPPFGPIVNGTQVIVFYHYRPNKPAGYIFVALFAIATLLHLVYLFRLRAWYFIPLILGGIGNAPLSLRSLYIGPFADGLRAAEVFGYYGRAWSNDDPNELGPWILQNFLILSAAPLIAATIYMTLGRLVTALDAEEHSIISPRWLAKIYVLIDVVCLGTQIAGTVLPASGDATVIETSRKLILGGLIAQLVALSFFVFMTWFSRRGISRSKHMEMMDGSLNWEGHFRALEAVVAFIILRSLVRTVEYAQGEDGYVLSHEVFIYLFDALLMCSVLVVYLVLHPSRLIRDARALVAQRRNTRLQGHIELDQNSWSMS